MAIESTIPRSRRALLAASLGGLAALAAGALGRPAPVRAEGEIIHVGEEIDTATSLTRIGNFANGAGVFKAYSASSGTGVEGHSSSGTGVEGNSSSGTGVLGWSQSSSEPAVLGHSYSGGGTGVMGFSDYGIVPDAPARTGLFGYAAIDSSSRGVWGQTSSGRGVNGTATTGRGVHGWATSGVGVYAACGNSGRAFQASGRVEFSTSGLASIGAAASSVAVTPGVDLTSTSRILCTLEGDPGAGVMIQRVVKNTTTDAFTVYLNKATVNAAKVAWFVIG